MAIRLPEVEMYQKAIDSTITHYRKMEGRFNAFAEYNLKQFHDALEKRPFSLTERDKEHETLYRTYNAKAHCYGNAAKDLEDTLWLVAMDKVVDEVNAAYTSGNFDCYEKSLEFWANALGTSTGIVEDAATDARLFGKDCG